MSRKNAPNQNMPNRIGIERVAVYIPEDRISFSHKTEEWRLNERFMKEKIGVLRVSRKRKDEKASNLGFSAFLELDRAEKVDVSKIELIVVVTQNPDVSVPHVSAMLQAKIGAPATCMALDISHGCSGYLYGLAVSQALMRDLGFRRALLVTSDPYSEIVDPEDRGTALLFGDAATVTLLSDTPSWECGHFSFHTEGQRSDSLRLKNGKLRMDGEDVFNFAATQVPRDIAGILERNSLSPGEIDLFLLHSGSRYIIDTISERARLPEGKVPFGIEDFGNTVSSSLPILISKYVRDDMSNVLMCGFGVGLSSAATVLRRVR